MPDVSEAQDSIDCARQSDASAQRHDGADKLSDSLSDLHFTRCTASAGLAFLMGPATSYALEPFAAEAGGESALNGVVQMAAAVSL